MAGEEPKTQEKHKAEGKPMAEAMPPGTFPGAPFLPAHLYPGFYSPFYPVATYPGPLFVGACPYHTPTAGQPASPIYRCPYCLPMQQQQNQNFNINIGGCFMPSGHNTSYYQASLLGATVIDNPYWTSC